jgi:ring-1,2-phenylacetyl-CoA epoxidase subunit PaaD
MVKASYDRDQVIAWLGEVPDPEIPVLTIMDLGIVRDVECNERITVSIAPTYSGCPATEAIEDSVIAALEEKGVTDIEIRRVLSPAWTTDWISEEGRRKLKEYGIAPPVRDERPVTCPRCESDQAELVSEFGSTACKAAYRCLDCLEPFEYFKCL